MCVFAGRSVCSPCVRVCVYTSAQLHYTHTRVYMYIFIYYEGEKERESEKKNNLCTINKKEVRTARTISGSFTVPTTWAVVKFAPRTTVWPTAPSRPHGTANPLDHVERGCVFPGRQLRPSSASFTAADVALPRVPVRRCHGQRAPRDRSKVGAGVSRRQRRRYQRLSHDDD